MDSKTEVVIGLVGAIGVDMDMVQRIVAETLDTVGFNPQPIHLSNLLSGITGFDLPAEANDQHYDVMVNARMEAGSTLRDRLGGDAMAKLAILAIQEKRLAIRGASKAPCTADEPIDRTAYVLRQLKHPEEVDLLREVYGDSFFLIAVHCPKAKRHDNLTDRIRKSYSRHRGEDFEDKAYVLMKKDEDEPERRLGQHVRRTFWRGDAYIDARTESAAGEGTRRVLNLWFGSPFITPSRDEFGMYVARAAALRSACMAAKWGLVSARRRARSFQRERMRFRSREAGSIGKETPKTQGITSLDMTAAMRCGANCLKMFSIGSRTSDGLRLRKSRWSNLLQTCYRARSSNAPRYRH